MSEIKDLVFKRVDGVDYSKIRNDLKLFNVFLAVDGERSVKTIAQDDAYELDYLSSIIDKMENMGLLLPVDGASRRDLDTPSEVTFLSLPMDFLTGIDAVDAQHQRLVDMVNQLDNVRKTHYPSNDKKHKVVGSVVVELIEYTISHFAFEESLMEDAEYKFLNAHRRIHELLVKRAGEYKERWQSGEDIVDELYEVLKRWLLNHIRNDDMAYAPAIKKRIKKIGKSRGDWLNRLVQKFFK
jgi:hemerythrin